MKGPGKMANKRDMVYSKTKMVQIMREGGRRAGCTEWGYTNLPRIIIIEIK
jgi:hypothetical protein